MKKASPFIFYLLFFAALAAYMPFLVLYFQGRGFSGAQIGLLTAVAPLISLIGGPFWTGLADATRRHKLIMSVTILLAISAVLMYPRLSTFAAVAGVVALFSFFWAPVNSLSDSATMAMLGGEKEMYGRVRLGGTIGWAISAPLVGMLVERSGQDMAFWSYAVLMFLAFLVVQTYTFPALVDSVSLRSGLHTLVRSPRWVLFMATAFVGGVGFATVNNYLFAYLEELNATKTLMGFALTISTLGELPVLFFANRLLRRFGGHGLLGLAIVATGIRLLLYGILSSPASVLVSQVMNGLTFPLFWVAGVSYADQNAPPGMSATAQGLLGAVTLGVGAATGGLLGGLLMDLAGGRGMYLIAGVVVLASFALIRLVERSRPARQYA